MTENKRFECDKGSRIIIDNETKLHYIMTLDWECRLITKLLNKFVEENEQLQKKNNNLVNMTARVQYRADLIKEENENFKKALRIVYSTKLTEPTKHTIEQIAKHCGVDLE